MVPPMQFRDRKSQSRAFFLFYIEELVLCSKMMFNCRQILILLGATFTFLVCASAKFFILLIKTHCLFFRV